MTTETFPIKIYFKVVDVLNNESTDTLDPIVTISVNNKVMLENINLNERLYNHNTVGTTSTVLPEWMEVDAHEDESTASNIAVVSFNVELDDDVESDISINVHLDNHDIPHHEDWGIFVSDIELNEISVENLVYNIGTINVPLCQEEDYDDDGFIQAYIIPEGLDKDLQLIDGRYHYITSGDYLHMEESSYNFTFKTPLYLWLLELLLQ